MTELLDQGAAGVRTGRTNAPAVAQFFTEYDYLLTPTTACVAWPVEQVCPALVPGISVPCGSGRDSPPVGLQIVAPCLHDQPLLAMAQRAEAALG